MTDMNDQLVRISNTVAMSHGLFMIEMNFIEKTLYISKLLTYLFRTFT
jgi:hypothetical protein